ncbi:MAG: tetratricopeptide repeat protein [Chthoniobacteraceae bacterium]
MTALLVRMLVLSRFAVSPHFWPATDDMRFYADWAIRISQGQWTDGQAFYGLPGYAFCLAGIFSLVGVSPLIVGVIQVGLETFTSVLIFKIARFTVTESQNREPAFAAGAVGILASLAWIFYLPAQTFSSILMPSAWLVAAFWGCVWWLVKGRAPSSLWTWLAFGVFLGVVSMIVATILFLIPLFLIAILLRSQAEKRLPQIGIAVALLFAGVFIGTSPAWLHNYFLAKDPVLLSAHGGLNFWMGNNPDATGYPKIPNGLSAGQEGLLRDSITRAEEAAGHKLKRSEVSKYWSGKADAWIRENRGAWFALLGVKLRNFWNAFQYDDLSEITLLREEGVLTPGITFGLVAVLGLPGMLMAAWRFPRARWVAAAVLLHICALMPVFITERYRLCAVPGLMVFAAFTIVEIWRTFAAARWLAAGVMLLAVGAASWFVSWPQREPGLWALDPFNTGLKVMRAGNLELAQTKLETALRLVPDNAEINFSLGNLWYEKGDMQRAKYGYRRAIELNDKHVSAWMNLGRVETHERQWDAAEKYLRAAITLDPASARAHLFFAELKLAQGDLSAARTAAAKAMELRPDQPELIELKKKIESTPAP